MRFTKREIPSGDGSGGLFLKLKDGESVVGVFRGEVYEFYSKWENNKSVLTTADDPDGKSRFRLNFVVKEDKFTAKIWEFGLTIYNQLADINEEYPLQSTKVKITRRGTGTDTIYMILPMLKEPIPAQAMKEIESLPLNILEHKGQPEKKIKNYAPGADEEPEF